MEWGRDVLYSRDKDPEIKESVLEDMIHLETSSSSQFQLGTKLNWKKNG
jgi:hypothetical protein